MAYWSVRLLLAPFARPGRTAPRGRIDASVRIRAAIEALEMRRLLSTTIFSDGFENATLSPAWTTRTNSGGNSTTHWGLNRTEASQGTQSIFCADTATGGLTPSTYTSNQSTSLLRGNVSLRDYLSASLSFKYFLNSEAGYDFFTVNAVDSSGVKTTLFRESGDDRSLGWQTQNIDVTDLAGETGLSFEFRFDSDSSVTNASPSGVWVDEVALTAGNVAPPGSISGTLFNDANANRTRDAGEGPLSGWVVYLDQNQNGRRDTDEAFRTSSSTGAYSFTGLTPDTYYVAEEVKSGYRQTYPGTVTTSSAYHIDVRFPDSSLTASQRAAFQTAAARWDRVITADLPNVNDNGVVIDDLLIDATAPSIDGTNGILGQAAPTAFRSGSLLPYRGFMEFDSADVRTMETSGQLVDVITHEMAHVLGFGTIWSDKGLISGAGGSDPRFIGANATAQYDAIFHSSASSVPVENAGSSGTRDSHWRESVFGNELMTGYLNPGADPLSRVTIGSMADLGYTVSYAEADPYNAPGLLSGTSNGFSHTVAVAAGQSRSSINFGNQLINRAPLISSLTDKPDPVAPGGTVLLTASGVSDPDGTVARVSFYRESNGKAGLQTGTGGDVLVGADTTASDGFHFAAPTAGLKPGVYTYYAQATDNGKAVGNVVSTTNSIRSTFMISGVVYHDLAANGYVDGSDKGMSGWRVYVDANRNGIFDTGERSTLTDAYGYYRFTGLAAGTYVVRDVLQSGFGRSAPGNGSQTVTLGSADATGRNFGHYRPAIVSGLVFRDANSNGAHDTGEPGLSGIRIYLDANGNGAYDLGEKSALSDASGTWRIANLNPGRYAVREVRPASVTRLVSPSTGSRSVTLTSGQSMGGVNFANA